MKRILLFVLLISSIGFTISAEETVQRDSVIRLIVDEDCNLQIDSLDKDRASIIYHDEEYFIYTNNKINIEPINNTIFANKYLSIVEPKKGGSFFTRRDRKPISDIKNRFNNNYIIGYDTGNFARAKFDVCGQKFYLCKPEYHKIDSTKMLIDTIGFHKSNAFVHMDTLSLSKTDTLHSIRIIEPKHAVFMSCSLNDSVLFDNKSFPIEEFNDPERTDSSIVELSETIWKQLTTGDKLHIKMAVLGDSGAFDKEYVQSYYLKVNELSFISKLISILLSPTIFCIVLITIVVIVLIIIISVVFRVRRNKSKKQNVKRGTDSIEKQENEDVAHNVGTAEPNLSVASQQDDILNQLKQKDIIISVHMDEVKRLQEEVVQYKASCKEQGDRVMELVADVTCLKERIAKYEAKINEYKEIVCKHEDTIKNDKATIINQNSKILSLEKEHNQQINDLNDTHESVRTELQNEINKLQLRLEELTSSWADDKKGIINFFTRYVDQIDQSVNVVLNDADPDSQAYMEISQMADSMNGYLSFKNKALEIFNQPALAISEVENLLTELLLSDVKYERSWFNTIARLYAYSQVNDFESIFGYYDSYADDIKRLYSSLENLSELFGISDIRIPVLFKDEFSSKKYEYKNTNLVLPQLYPDYVGMLKPMVVYDFSRVGYTYKEEAVKPIVAYNTK